MVGFVRSKSSIRAHILDDAIIDVLVKRVIFQFIGYEIMKNCIALCESRQY